MMLDLRNITLHVTNTLVVPGTPEMNAELQKIAEARKKYGEAKKSCPSAPPTTVEQAAALRVEAPGTAIMLHTR